MALKGIKGPLFKVDALASLLAKTFHLLRDVEDSVLKGVKDLPNVIRLANVQQDVPGADCPLAIAVEGPILVTRQVVPGQLQALTVVMEQLGKRCCIWLLRLCHSLCLILNR